MTEVKYAAKKDSLNRTPIDEMDKFEICPSYSNPLIMIFTYLVSFSSIIFGILMALFFKYNLQIKMYLYSRNLCLWWIKEDDIDKDKKYDMFLSFCHEDNDLVMLCMRISVFICN